MEKRRPSYRLGEIKRAIGSADSLSITRSALQGAAEIGFDRERIANTIQDIEQWMFYKSMTTFADHRVWQDVYHVPADGLTLYMKFQADVLTEFRLVSFKEK